MPIQEAAILAVRTARVLKSVLAEFIPREMQPKPPKRQTRIEAAPQGRRRHGGRSIFGLSIAEALVLAVMLPVLAAFLLLLAKHLWPMALLLFLALTGALVMEIRRRAGRAAQQ